MKRINGFLTLVDVGVGNPLKKGGKAESIEEMLKDHGYSEKTTKKILKWYAEDA